MVNRPEDEIPHFDEIDYDEISGFFTRTGAVELISLLDYTGYRFDEIDEMLDCSRGTLHKRRNEAVGLGLVDYEQDVRDEGVRRVFILTSLGFEFNTKMKRIGLIQTHERLRAIRDEYYLQKSEFTDWIDDPERLQEDIEERLAKRYQGLARTLETVDEDDVKPGGKKE